MPEGHNISKSIHRYLKTEVGFCVAKDEQNSIYVYVKIQGFVIVGYIKMNKLKDFRSTRISPKEGVVEVKNHFYIGLWNFIQKEADISLRESKEISEPQKSKENAKPPQDLKKYFESNSGKALLDDYEYFGDSTVL